MSDRTYEERLRDRQANMARVLTRIVEAEWRRVFRELDSLDEDADEARVKAAQLVGQFQILDKLMKALSEGSLGSDYEIEASWREKVVQRVIEGFELDLRNPTPPRRYRGLAQQVAEACGLEVIDP